MSFVGPHNILRLIQVVVIKINIPRTPQPPLPLSPNPIPLFFQIHYILHLLLAAPQKESEVLCVDEYTIILLILYFQNLIKKKCIVLEFEHIWAPIFFFYPFSCRFISILVFTSWLCLHESGMILFSQNVYCVDQQMIHILLYFVDLFLIFHGMLFHSFALQLNV